MHEAVTTCLCSTEGGGGRYVHTFFRTCVGNLRASKLDGINFRLGRDLNTGVEVEYPWVLGFPTYQLMTVYYIHRRFLSTDGSLR